MNSKLTKSSLTSSDQATNTVSKHILSKNQLQSPKPQIKIPKKRAFTREIQVIVQKNANLGLQSFSQ